MATKPLNKLRSFLWPIYRQELIKFLPMFLLFFLIAFNYHLLRITKDALVITAPKSGAEIIPFLKVWAMLPAAVLMTFFYTRLANHFSREKVFYVITGFFLAFFLIFLLFIYPHREALYLNNFGDSLQASLPQGFKGFIAIIRYWMFSLYYIFAEGWSTIMLSLLLWGFANDVTSVAEAKRFYAMFGIAINASGIFAGFFGEKLAHFMKEAALGGSAASWDQTLNLFVIIILVCGILAMIIHRWLHVKIFTHRRHAAHLSAVVENPSSSNPSEKPKPQKMSLRMVLTYVLKSPYLLYLSLIVLCYNMVVNFTEVLWKSQMREAYPNPADYTAYMSSVTFYIGILATIGAFFFSGNVIRYFGWKKAAMVTPVIAGLTGLGFFYFLFNKTYFPSYWHLLAGISPLTLAVFFGSMQNVFLRSCKYTLFDSTKEMAFIPLSSDSRIKGKSVIDGIGSRLGKSGSSFILTLLLMFLSSPIACSGFVFVVMALIFPIWMISIKLLSKKFQALTEQVAPGQPPSEQAQPEQAQPDQAQPD